jgi:hypothetical protein
MRNRLLGPIALSLVICLASDALALGKDKVRLVAGSTEDTSPTMAPWAGNEGRIGTSEKAFVFAVGDRSFMIPYTSIVSLHYGHVPRENILGVARRGRRIRIPDDFAPVVHDLLTLTYRGQNGEQHVALFWVGEEIVKPTLANLERRTGHEIQFDRIGACVQVKTPDECGDGHPRTLRGLTRVFINVQIGFNADDQSRERIVSEIASAGLGLELLDNENNAQVVLIFRADYVGIPPGVVTTLVGKKYGTGWVYLVQDGRLRELFAFADEKQSILARMPATNFAKAFVREYERANR